MSRNAIRTQTLGAVIEDHAMSRVPDTERRSGWGLLMNTAGMGTALVVLSIGGAVTAIAGTGWGLAMSVVAAVFGSFLGYGITRVCQISGTSSTVTSRFYGLGTRGSALASLIFGFMILGFLALENALLYYGTLFMFGWAPTLWNAILIYGILTVAWIVLAMFGIGLVQRTSTVLTIATLVLIVFLIGVALANSSTSLQEIATYSPPNVGFTEITAALTALAGIAGSLALTGADFGRFARSAKDVRIMAIGGAVVVNIVVVILGTLIFQAGHSVVAAFLEDPANLAVAATQPGTTTEDKIGYMSKTNIGAYFVVLAGVLGFAVVYAAQAKAQVINTYSGSLALSNLSDALFRRTPGRLTMVILGNIIGLLAIMGNILDLIGSWLGVLGILTTSLCVLMIMDYYVLRRRELVHPDTVEEFNWAGIVTVLAGSGIAQAVTMTGVTSMGFLIAGALTAIGYPLLRRTILPEGRGSRFVSTATALREASE